MLNNMLQAINDKVLSSIFNPGSFNAVNCSVGSSNCVEYIDGFKPENSYTSSGPDNQQQHKQGREPLAAS
jgi:hypothetical protein